MSDIQVSFTLKASSSKFSIDPNLVKSSLQSMLGDLDRVAGYGMGLYITDLTISSTGLTLMLPVKPQVESAPIVGEDGLDDVVNQFYVPNSPILRGNAGIDLQSLSQKCDVTLNSHTGSLT